MRVWYYKNGWGTLKEWLQMVAIGIGIIFLVGMVIMVMTIHLEPVSDRRGKAVAILIIVVLFVCFSLCLFLIGEDVGYNRSVEDTVSMFVE